MSIEILKGRPVCTRCGNEWSACLGDDEIPKQCDCETLWNKKEIFELILNELTNEETIWLRDKINDIVGSY